MVYAQIAYVARFYSPPASRVTSHYAVYLSRFDGTGRKRIASASDDDAVAWVDAQTLAVFRRAGTTELYSANGKYLKRFKNVPDNIYGVDRFVAYPHEGNHGFGSLTRNGYKSTVRPWWLPVAETKDDSIVVQMKGQRLTYPIPIYENSPASFMRVVRFNNQNYFVGGSLGASAGEDLAIWRLRPNAPAIRVSDYVSDPKIEFSRSMYVGLSPGRPIQDYGKKGRRVWTSDVFVGRLGSTKARKVTRGLVMATSAAIRPLR